MGGGAGTDGFNFVVGAVMVLCFVPAIGDESQLQSLHNIKLHGENPINNLHVPSYLSSREMALLI